GRVEHYNPPVSRTNCRHRKEFAVRRPANLISPIYLYGYWDRPHVASFKIQNHQTCATVNNGTFFLPVKCNSFPIRRKGRRSDYFKVAVLPPCFVSHRVHAHHGLENRSRMRVAPPFYLRIAFHDVSIKHE